MFGSSKCATMKVSCIVPAYNEASQIVAVVEAARDCPEVDEVIVVSDGSTDDTARRAAEAGAHRIIVLPANRGKGGAVAAAIPHAGGEILLLLDADLYGLHATHITRLLAPVRAGRADMAVGLFTDDPLHGLLYALSGQRAVHRRLLQPEVLAGTGYGFELALDRQAHREHARVVHVPLAGVTHRRKRRKYGTVRGFRQEVRASSDLLRQARRALMRRADPDISVPKDIVERARPRPMTLAAVILMLLILLLAPVFLAPPSHAARIAIASPLQPGDRLLLVVAHPDDEIIGAGGLVATARRAGIPVSVLVLTNGDSNRLSAALLGRHLPLRPFDFVKTGRVRHREALEALTRLGVPVESVFFLGFPDRMLSQVLASETPIRSPFTRLSQIAADPGVVAAGAPYTGPVLRALVQQIVTGVRPTAVVTHAPFDSHSDHRAAYALVRPLVGNSRLYTFLVHAAAFPRPLRFAPRDELRPPAHLARPDGWAWIEFPLSPEAERNKHEALNAHRSQLETPYLRLLLTGFVRANELFAVRVGSMESPK